MGCSTSPLSSTNARYQSRCQNGDHSLPILPLPGGGQRPPPRFAQGNRHRAYCHVVIQVMTRWRFEPIAMNFLAPAPLPEPGITGHRRAAYRDRARRSFSRIAQRTEGIEVGHDAESSQYLSVRAAQPGLSRPDSPKRINVIAFTA